MRIRIGRFADQSSWSRAIAGRGVKWLLQTPKIKVTDHTRLIFIDMLKGNYTKSAIQHWQEASLLLGLMESLKHNDEIVLKKQILKYLNTKYDQHGQWIQKPKEIDAAIHAYALMKLDFINIDTYKKALDTIWELIQDHLGSDGTVLYRKHMKDYRYVDTIGFICPFLVAYGLRYNKPECVDLAVKQIKHYEQFGALNQNGLLCHAYKEENKAPLGLFGWGRGLGWFAIGLIDSWRELPRNHPYRNQLNKSVLKFAHVAMETQQDHGGWNWTVTRSESTPDSSTTATLAWFLVNASEMESISNRCLESTDKAMNFLMKVTRRDGAIDFSQGDTKDIGVYSVLFNILPFTQGFGIRTIHLFTYKTKENDKKEFSNEDHGVYSCV